MILAKKKRSIITLKINSIAIHETNNVALLGITTDNNLSFMEHIENLFRQVNFKLHLLQELGNIYSQKKRGYYVMFLLIASFIMYQSFECFAIKMITIKWKKSIIEQ